ncbi:hypothetical protein CR513_42694, partial [Mucuna pruriens]
MAMASTTTVLAAVHRAMAFPNVPISSGKQPPRPLPDNTISFMCFIFPIVLGMQPVSLLLAKVTTEALDFPIVSGIVDVKRLLFKKIASRSFSNSCGGKGPSKSLYLISKYLRFGHWRTIEGKGPTKRLLLISNSCISEKFIKASGTTPQNLLELIWKSAISVKLANSCGRRPAMSALLRSIPATTFNEGLSFALVVLLTIGAGATLVSSSTSIVGVGAGPGAGGTCVSSSSSISGVGATASTSGVGAKASVSWIVIGS